MNLNLAKKQHAAWYATYSTVFKHFSIVFVSLFFLNEAQAFALTGKTAAKAAFLSGNANLSSLTISAGTLSPTFNNNTFSYYDTVAYSVTSVTVTAVRQESPTQIKINGHRVQTGVPSAGITLQFGLNQIPIETTAEDGTRKIFYINVYRLDNNPLVKGISAYSDVYASRSYSFSPVFNTSIANYTGTINNFSENYIFVQITWDPAHPKTTAKINGVTANNWYDRGYKTAGAKVNMIPGQNVITVETRSEDGSATKTYTIALNRPGNITDLSRIYDQNNDILTPYTFNKDSTSYHVVTKPGIDSITLNPLTTDVLASLKINGVAVAKGVQTKKYALVNGGPTAAIEVTGFDGVTTKTYNIYARKLTLNGGVSASTVVYERSGLFPLTFAPTDTLYEKTVGDNEYQLNVNLVADDSREKIYVWQNQRRGTGSLSFGAGLNYGENIINFTVFSPDDVFARFGKKYTIKITRLSKDASLSNLTVSTGGLNPVFDSDELEYTADTTAASSITVTPTATSPYATIKVNGVSVTNGYASAAIPLSLGDNVINTVVTAQDTTQKRTYTTTVNRIYGAALLANLVLSTGSVDPAFSSGKSYYELAVANTTSSISIKPIASSTYPSVGIKVNGVSVSSDTFSAPITLTGGSNLITVTVTSADQSQTHEYKIVVLRASNNASLASLNISTTAGAVMLSPAFSSSVTDYTCILEHDFYDFILAAETEDSGARITTSVLTGSTTHAVSLGLKAPIGTTPYTITVTSQDGATSKTYRLNVVHVSNNGYLKALKVNENTLTPSFNHNVFWYKDTVLTSTVDVTPVAGNSKAGILINGLPALNNKPKTLSLAKGYNIFAIKVTSQDSTRARTYMLRVIRHTKNGLLNGIDVSSGHLYPAFSPLITAYKDTVADGTYGLSITPHAFAEYPKIRVTVNGRKVTPGAASPMVTLARGNNTITINVTSADYAHTKTYTINVMRISNDSKLENFVSSVGMSPAFSKYTHHYVDTVVSAETISFTLTPISEYATVSPSYRKTLLPPGVFTDTRPLKFGENKFSFSVFSQLNTYRTTYKLIVYRLSGNTNLKSLAVSIGNITPVFTAAQKNYMVALPNSVTSIKITPAAVALHALVKVNGISQVRYGAESAPIPLSVGLNTITTEVTAEDGTQSDIYTITVTRAPVTLAARNPQVAPDIIKPQSKTDIATAFKQPFIKQALSPNGDGINDVLLIDGVENFSNNKLTIVDREGSVVFEQTRYDNVGRSFNGHVGPNGRLLPAGTYFYSFEYATADSSVPQRKTGFFILKY